MQSLESISESAHTAPAFLWGKAPSFSCRVLLSGGVDSSVALALLKHAGVSDLQAFYLKIWLEDDTAHLGHCPWQEDLDYARAVCEQLNVPLEIISLQSEYYDLVVEHALAELRRGHTPSPDIFCNTRIKFGAFLKVIRENDMIATGHYAHVERVGNEVQLWRGVDPVKDQSYFLSHLDGDQLGRLIFPLGDLHKREIRSLAQSYGLKTADRPDSQGICFLGKIPYNEFVRFHLGERRGEIREILSGKKLGEHKGFWFHTIGQRKGLGLSGGPWFVAKKDCDENVIYVAHETTRIEASTSHIRISKPHWITTPSEKHLANLEVKLRHGPNTTPAKYHEDGADFFVLLNEPDYGVAAGQYCVFYSGRVCLGSAMIVGSEPNDKTPD